MNLSQELKKQADALRETLKSEDSFKANDMPSKIDEISNVDFKPGYPGVAIFPEGNKNIKYVGKSIGGDYIILE